MNLFVFSLIVLTEKYIFASAFEKQKQNEDDSVAQLVEHIPFKDGVLGPNPNWVTIAKLSNPCSTRLAGVFYFSIRTTIRTTDYVNH